MKLKLFAIAAAFILIGAGCTLTQTAEVGDLPTTPPQDAMMEGDTIMPEPDDEVMVEAEGGAMMDGGAENDGSEAMMDDGAMEKDDSEAMEGDSSAMSDTKPYYIAYTADVAAAAQAEGRPVVYYFWAAWCPICKAEEPKIKSWIETSEHPVAGFRVNYDIESALKAKFKVPYQHTTVFLNAEGVEVERFSGPVTEAEFRAALALASK